MIKIGLTGSIGSGKTTISKMFEKLGVQVFNADFVASNLMNTKKVKRKLIKIFPNILQNGNINKAKLREIVLNDLKKLDILEKIIHPLVNKQRMFFVLKNYICNHNGIILFDTALLFEANIDKLCDYIIVVYCNKKDQEDRILKRNNMTLHDFKRILSRQTSIEIKKTKANFLINTSNSLNNTENEVKYIFSKIKNGKKK